MILQFHRKAVGFSLTREFGISLICPLREAFTEKNTFSFGHCPNHPIPSPLHAILTTFSLFFRPQNKKGQNKFGQVPPLIWEMPRRTGGFSGKACLPCSTNVFAFDTCFHILSFNNFLSCAPKFSRRGRASACCVEKKLTDLGTLYYKTTNYLLIREYKDQE